jgi:hypothetical protein
MHDDYGSGHGGAGVPSDAAVSPAVVRVLLATKPWVRFFSVLGFIGSGLLVVVGLVFGAVGSLSEELGIAGGFVGFIYAALAVVYFFPSLFLYRYASGIRDFVGSGSSQSLEVALSHQLKFWRFMGTATIVMFCLYVMVFVVIAIVAGLSA